MRGEDELTARAGQHLRLAREVTDCIGVHHDLAFVLEHHAPKGSGGVRDLSPFGSSLWLRWGEIRMSLMPPDKSFPIWTMELVPFSGSRTEHGWPQHVDRNRGEGMPWLGRWQQEDGNGF